MVNVIDLKFQGFSRAIASFLVESGDGPILIETGPHSTYKTLERGVNRLGYNITDVRHVLLSHIHFDHAGAAWALARQGAKIYLHPSGAKHMEDPSRLYQSAKRIYQDKMEALWGLLEPIPKDRLYQVQHRETLKIGKLKLTSHHTPGHAVHHIAWQLEDVLFTGDVAGVKIDNGPVVPPCPPPDINIEDWKDSVQLIQGLEVRKLYLTHFGAFDHVKEHMAELEACLDSWSGWIKDQYDRNASPGEITPKFQAFADAQLATKGLSSNGIARYAAANPAWMSVAGLMRYWQKKEEGKFG